SLATLSLPSPPLFPYTTLFRSEPEYTRYAKLIFGNTPEMMEFFSNKFGYDFPWDKYSQIVVRDFVSGAMENTSAVVHFEGLQHRSEEHTSELQSRENLVCRLLL